MGAFTIIDHTADVGVHATGRDFATALSWAAKGMFSVITDLELVEHRRTFQVNVTSHDDQTLVVDWLNELLYIYETEGLLMSEFKATIGRKKRALEAECFGEPVDLSRHRMKLSVKAATYHELEVQNNGDWHIKVVLDV